MLDDVGKDIEPIRRGGGLRGMIGGAGQTMTEERTTTEGSDGTERELARADPAPVHDTATTADASAAPPAPAPAGPARRSRAAAPAAAPTTRRQRAATPQADSALRKNKTFTLRTDLARRLAVTAATLDLYEYIIVERAIVQHLRALPADATPTRRRRGSDAIEQETVQRKNKTFTLLPDIVRDVAVAAASHGMFEYEIVEPAVERYLDRLAGRGERGSEA